MLRLSMHRRSPSPLFAVQAGLTLALVACGEPDASGSPAGTGGDGGDAAPMRPDLPDGDGGSNDTGGDGEGCNFLACPDPDDPGLDYESCNMWAPECGSGEKCVPTKVVVPDYDAWFDWICVDIDAAPVGPGERCETRYVEDVRVDDCDATSVCHDVDPDTGEGVCAELCGGEPQAPECDDGSHCWFSSGGLYALCLDSCDPVADVLECPGGQHCVPFVQGGLYIDFVCFPPHQPQFSGQPCWAANGCEADHMCLDDFFYGPACDGDACCSPLCEVGDPPGVCAEPGHECVAMFGPGHPTLAHLGRCQQP